MRAPSASLRHELGAQADPHQALRDLREVFKLAVMWAVQEWGESAPEAIEANGLNDPDDDLAGRMTADDRLLLAGMLRRSAAEWAIGQGMHPEDAIARHKVTSGSSRDHLRFCAARRAIANGGMDPEKAIAAFKVRVGRRRATLRAMRKPQPAPKPGKRPRKT